MKIDLIFSLVMVAALTVCIIALFMMYCRLKLSFEGLQASYHNLELLNSQLRAQRHDYLNHLQVVYGLMELEEYEELRKYLTPVFKDMLKTGKALKTSKPAINALLCAKREEAEGRGIDFYVEVKSDLKELQMEDWELCKVLANLFDNGMTALEQRSGERKLMLEISEDREKYYFSVSNNGPAIPANMQQAIFKQGFTTKLGEGHGMGLYIVMNVLKEYKGSIQVTSKEEGTEFTFCLPKNERR